MAAPTFEWDDQPYEGQSLENQQKDGWGISDVIHAGHAIYMQSSHKGSKKKGKKKSSQTSTLERQVEALFLSGCAYLGISVPSIVSKQIISQIISQAQNFPQGQQILALLGQHQSSDVSGSNSDSSSGGNSKKKHKKKEKL
jgi:hypothetical protein